MRASHILLQSTPDDTEEDKKKNRDIMEDIVKQTKSGLNTFARLAMKYSQDNSADRGGRARLSY